MYDPTIDSYRDTDDDTKPAVRDQWVQDGIVLALLAMALIAVLVLCSGCQSIQCKADNGASITIEGSNSKPINAATDWKAGDAALSAAAALAGGGTGAALGGAPGALAGAGVGYLCEAVLNGQSDAEADGATCPLPAGNVEFK